MEQTGEHLIAAPRKQVWAALNDPEVLQRCIEGCQSMDQLSDTSFATAVKAKIGPVSALFKADLELTELDPPNSYKINASAKGGAAGFGKGSASVHLLDEGASTRLNYSVNANVGGKLAQIGSRLIDAAARKMADDFFAKFTVEVGGATQEVGEVEAEPMAGDATASNLDSGTADSTPESGYQPSQQWMIWAIMFGVLVLAVVLTL